MELAPGVPGNLTLLSSDADGIEYDYVLNLEDFIFDSDTYIAIDEDSTASVFVTLLPENLRTPLVMNVYLKVLDISGDIFDLK